MAQYISYKEKYEGQLCTASFEYMHSSSCTFVYFKLATVTTQVTKTVSMPNVQIFNYGIEYWGMYNLLEMTFPMCPRGFLVSGFI